MPICTSAYASLSNEEKCGFLNKFAFFTSAHSTLDKNLRTIIHAPSTHCPFAADYWDKLDITTQIDILASLKELDKFSSHKYKFSLYELPAPWSSFAEHIVPRLIDKLFTPDRHNDEMDKHRQTFLSILARNVDYTSAIKKGAGFKDSRNNSIFCSSELSYHHIVINTLLNYDNLDIALDIAAFFLNVDMIITLLKLRAHANINSSHFEASMLKAWGQILTNENYDLTTIAISIKKILNYLTPLFPCFAEKTELRILKNFKEELTKCCTENPKLADYFDYQAYGIKLPNDPEPQPSLLTQFGNFQYKEFVAGAVSATITAAIAYKMTN
jgi:hypothetical protein